jgi:protein SCO1/2
MNKKFKFGRNSSFVWLPTIILVPSIIYLLVNRYEPLKVYNQIEGWTRPGDTALISNYLFTDQQERQVSLRSFPGKIEVVNFFFSRCPGVCPKMMSGLGRVTDKYAQDARVHFLSFSVDPKYDSPSRLAHYAEALGVDAKQWQLLTGDKRKIYRMARTGFHVDASEGDGGPDNFIHSDKIILVDNEGRIRGYYSGIVPSEMDKLINDIKKLQHEE